MLRMTGVIMCMLYVLLVLSFLVIIDLQLLIFLLS